MAKPYDITSPLTDDQAFRIDQNFNAVFETLGSISNDLTVRNGDTVLLVPGMPVYMDDADGLIIVVKRAKADSTSTMEAIGLVVANIAPGEIGTVRTKNTLTASTQGFNTGDVLYVSAGTAGALTSTKPTGANIPQSVATVISVGEQGSLYVNIGTASERTTNALLDGSIHTDTVAQTVTRGSLIYGNATPAWDELVIGAANRLLRSDGTDVSWAQAVLTTDVTGVLPEANGGTNQSTYTTGDLLYASAANTLSKLADVATGNALISGGIGVAPSWGKIGLTTHVTGVLPIANGGTNSSTALSGSSIAISNGSAIVQGAAGTSTTILHGNAVGAPTYSAVSLTADVSGILPIANGGTGLSAIAGSDTQVLFNDGGAFGADAGLTYNKTTDALSLAGHLILTQATESQIRSNTTDGSDNHEIIIAGGGTEGQSRGGSLHVHGNETVSQPGHVKVNIGNVATAEFQVDRGDGTTALAVDGVTGNVNVETDAGFGVIDTNASHYLRLDCGSDLTADRILSLVTGDAARTVTLGGNPTLNDWFDQSIKTTASPTFVGLTLSGAIATPTTLTLSSNIIFTAAAAVLQNTADGSDTRFTSIAGGGASTTNGSRGAQVNMYGNDHATNAGQYGTFLGSAAGAMFFVDSGANRWLTVLGSTGIVGMPAYGAGTATFDANGNISSVSDERMKEIQGPFTPGLNAVLGLRPILYRYTKASGMDYDNIYAGFSAQNIMAYIPEAIGKTLDNHYSLNVIPILASVVTAMQELTREVDELRAATALPATPRGMTPVTDETRIVRSATPTRLAEIQQRRDALAQEAGSQP